MPALSVLILLRLSMKMPFTVLTARKMLQSRSTTSSATSRSRPVRTRRQLFVALLAVLTFLQITFGYIVGRLGVIFILLPLWKNRVGMGRATGRWWALAYFAMLGLGFILIEISFVQKLVLFLGSPTYSLTVVLFSQLIGGLLLFGLATAVARSMPPAANDGRRAPHSNRASSIAVRNRYRRRTIAFACSSLIRSTTS